jgi:hypothetical protein
MKAKCLAAACGVASVLGVGTASAATVCSSVAEFNAFMVENGTHSTDVTLTFDVTGVNPSDFHNGKGSLSQMRNTACNGGAQDSVIKVYGTSEPLNTSHPPGTLKLEYGNQCCVTACGGENWASPNPSEVIFVDGTEQCKVTMWTRPDSIGYKLECNTGTFEAIGDNDEANVVNHIALLEYFVSDGGNTWELPNATMANDQVCYEKIDTGLETLTVPVAEDVTTGPSYPTSVFPDVGDLAVEAGDHQAYLKFVVPEIPGKVTQVRLTMHTRTESFSEGDGGEVYAVADSNWSETTLTWNDRPPYSGASFGRIGPATADQAVTLDLGTAVTGPGTYSFAVVSPPTDGNGTHFFSKEGSPADGPSLRISYSVTDGDGDGTPDGPDCNDADPAVNPGAVEACNGADDDCDGQVDEGCGGGWGGSSNGPGSGGSGTGGGSSASDDAASSGSCAMSAHRSESWSLAALAALLVAARRRRRLTAP